MRNTIYMILFLSLCIATESPSSPVPAKRPLTSIMNSDRRVIMGSDGTLYLMDKSRKVWKVSSGPPIYSSYHQGENRDDFHIYLDDGELYMQGAGLKKTKLPLSVEELVKRSPLILSGGVLFVSKRASIFLVGADSGRIFRRISDSLQSFPSIGEHTPTIATTEIDIWLPASSIDAEVNEATYYIRRIDYVMSYTSATSDEVLWYLRFYEIEILYGCEAVGDFLGGVNCVGKHRIPAHGSLSLHIGDASYGQLPTHEPSEPKQSYSLIAIVTAIATIILFSCIGAATWKLHRGRLLEQTLDKQNLDPQKPKKKSKKSRSQKTNNSSIKLDVTTENMGSGSNDKSVAIGQLIGFGSNGTIVFEGEYGGRTVAIKRVVKSFYNMAMKEFAHLDLSDQHPNIVQMYGKEVDNDFVYLYLERCACNLYELVTFSDDARVLLTTLGSSHELQLWVDKGYPSQLLIKLMRDIVGGVSHLHKLRIIHRDLKPQNILLVKSGELCAKVSDMGISKRLREGVSSSMHATGSGTQGWQAPEILKGQKLGEERHTFAEDLFSLGCILFFSITQGKHPFGEGGGAELDANILNDNKVQMFLIDDIPEACDLISRLLNPEPKLRPNVIEVLNHPMFWDPELKLLFLQVVNEKVQGEDKASSLRTALEGRKKVIFGAGVCNWGRKMDKSFMSEINSTGNKYDCLKVAELLRVIRNKCVHYGQSSQNLQQILGPLPEGFYNHFSTRFPKLLIEVYDVIRTHCSGEKRFRRYF